MVLYLHLGPFSRRVIEDIERRIALEHSSRLSFAIEPQVGAQVASSFKSTTSGLRSGSFHAIRPVSSNSAHPYSCVRGCANGAGRRLLQQLQRNIACEAQAKADQECP
jgi:hypothetical protein